eukprot:5721395-Alexandrium_andersonii.AAC.1
MRFAHCAPCRACQRQTSGRARHSRTAAVPRAWRQGPANAGAPEPQVIPRAAQPEPEPARPRAPPAPKRASITRAMLEEH